MKLTHRKINQIAQRWLLRPVSNNGAGCKIAFTEVGAAYSSEQADAWGFHWDSGISIVVETKVSRADFLADKKKPHRCGQKEGMGVFRYYICPEGLITEKDLPEKWGLLYVNQKGHVKLVCGHLSGNSCFSSDLTIDSFQRWRHQANRDLEQKMMGILLRQVGDAETLKESLRELKRENRMLRSQIESKDKTIRDFAMSAENIGRMTNSINETKEAL